MFEFNPDMIQDDEGEEGEDALAQYRRQDVCIIILGGKAGKHLVSEPILVARGVR